MQVLKEETRNQILESTRQDIITYGIDNVSLRRIARNIGMSPSNIYNYFKNKEELIESIVLPGIQQIDKLFSDISNNRLEFNLKELNNSKSDFAKLSVKELAVKIFELYKKLDVAVIIILGSEQYI
jgi:AcrR family transcriptional regulator